MAALAPHCEARPAGEAGPETTFTNCTFLSCSGLFRLFNDLLHCEIPPLPQTLQS